MAAEACKRSGECRPAVLHIMVIGFHHQKGSTVEFSYPPLRQGYETHGDVTQSLTSILPQEWRSLPHLALPDGSHNYESDSVYFTLPFPSDRSQSVYGVACSRQIDVRKLHTVHKDITRSTVQKSVCVLCRFPAFNFIESRLEIVTHAYFNSKDFTSMTILHEAFDSFNMSITVSTALQVVHFGLSQRTLALHYHHRLLQIIKALLLQKRVVVFGSPAKQLCNTVLSIAALFPGTLEHLVEPEVPSSESGFSLHILDSPNSLQPYVSLQQMDLMLEPPSQSPGLLAGVINPLYEKQQKRICDVFVHADKGLIDIQDQETKSLLRLTSADLRFCSHITDVVQEHTGMSEPASFYGSSEWVKTQYTQYIQSLLATSECGDTAAMDEYDHQFMSSWLESSVFKKWKNSKRGTSSGSTTAEIEPRHPCEGGLSLGDVQRRLAAQASDYGVNLQSREQVVKQTQQALNRAADRVTSAVNGAWFTASSAVYSWWNKGGRAEDTTSRDS